jgi:hypothetical protein
LLVYKDKKAKIADFDFEKRGFDGVFSNLKYRKILNTGQEVNIVVRLSARNLAG